MSGPTLEDALDAAKRGESVTVTLDAATVEALALFQAARKRAWRRRHLDDAAGEYPPGYAPGAPVAVDRVLWLAALARLKLEAAETLLAADEPDEEAER